ncbi:Fc.00g025040.m01.CDS01 [Cosmosporella sp. VM-42]
MLATRVPLSWYFSKFQGVAQSRVMFATDARIRRVTETIQGLQTIKMLGQKASFVRWIDEKRNLDLQALRHKWIIVVLSESISNAFILVPLVLFLALYTLGSNKSLDPWVVFTVLSIFNTLQKMLTLTVIGASTYAQSMVSLRRLASFLDDTSTIELDEDSPSKVSQSLATFGCKNATVYVQTHQSRSTVAVKSASFELVRGGLNLMVGKTGSGKSSLPKALLNELPLSSGHASSRSNPSETLSYAPQAPWLQRGTIRDNILLSSPFSLKRYDTVLRATALDVNLKSFADGDLSDVGESGRLLSGGQRARVGLARAIYASTRTVVLDDVLSALDANTESFVAENAICGPLMKDRTVVLVSENAKCIANADQLIELDHGEVTAVTRHMADKDTPEMKTPKINIYQEEVLASCSSTIAVEEETNESSSVNSERAGNGDRSVGSSDPGSEAILTGLIGRLAMFKYFGHFGDLPKLSLLCAVLLAAQTVDVASSLWLTIWSSGRDSNALFNISIYFTIGIMWNLFATLGTLFLFAGAIRAGRSLHSGLLNSVLGATFVFVTSTPAGQIMNRFSSDIFSIDNTLPELVKQVAENYLSIILRLAAVSSMLPVFLLPALVFLGTGFMTGQVYMYGSTASKRLYAAGLSPLLSAVADSVSGIEVIRAHGAQAEMQSKFTSSLEIYLRGWETASACQRWLAVRMDFLAGMISISTASLAFILSSDNPAKVGFSLTSSSALCTTILYAVYLSSVLEVELNSFQRVEQYIRGIPQEQISGESENLMNTSWPSRGYLRVSHLSVGYSLDGELVLRDISFSVRPGKRVAIVGRSGSGKSSLVASILRLAIKHSGNISIDGVDVEDVGVERLRQAISFIPQDPTFFEGSLKFNLDFTGRVPDSSLQAILGQVLGSNSSSQELTQDLWSLERPISNNGSNLSQGERQLVAMDRVLATDARTVIIDEATASLDHESERRMQQLLRERFADRALVAVAHRLHTILDFDEVLVMEMGRVIERGCPKTLIESGEGRFWEMWVANEG